MKKAITLSLILLLITFFSSCSEKEVSFDLRTDGIYTTKEGKTPMDLHPYVSFGKKITFRIVFDLEHAYGLNGEYCRDGNRITVKRKGDTITAPVIDDAFIEFQMLSETELKVTEISESFFKDQSWMWLEEGDILVFSQL